MGCGVPRRLRCSLRLGRHLRSRRSKSSEQLPEHVNVYVAHAHGTCTWHVAHARDRAQVDRAYFKGASLRGALFVNTVLSGAMCTRHAACMRGLAQ